MAASTSRCGVDHACLRRLASGVYEDASGRYLHLCLVEICEEAGYAPTAANLDVAEEMLRELVAEQWPNLPVLVAGDAPSERPPPNTRKH